MPASRRSSSTPATDPARPTGTAPADLQLINPALLDLVHDERPEVTARAEWVFAYGSLIWNPEFPYAEQSPALIRGYHRAFCIRSTMYRGTPESPGLVLGLDNGGACRGVAFRLQADSIDDSLQALYVREMTTSAYCPRVIPTQLDDGRIVKALAFVANHHSKQYAKLDASAAAQVIGQCRGCRGLNLDYARNTMQALHQAGIHDPRLSAIVAKAEQVCRDSKAQDAAIESQRAVA